MGKSHVRGRRLLAIAAAAGLVAATLAAVTSPAAAQPRVQVDSEVYAQLSEAGSTEFFVFTCHDPDPGAGYPS